MSQKDSEKNGLLRRLSDVMWQDYEHRSWPVRWLLSELRVFYFVGRGFRDHNCPLRASTLTFVTLLSIVPIMALVFAFAKGFEIDEILWNRSMVAAPAGDQATSVTLGMAPDAAPSTDTLAANRGFVALMRDALTKQLTADQEEVRDRIASYVQNTWEKTPFGHLKTLSLLFLIVAVISALSTMEHVFNEIWSVRRARPLLRKVADYLSVVIICPVLLVVAMAMTATLSSTALVERLRQIGFLNEVIARVFALAPYLSVWLALTFLYLFLPNTRVRLRCAMIGGFIAGVVWQLAFWAYTAFQAGLMKRYGAIYSSLAALPFFMTWLYASWLIVLFGAEIAAAYQNIEAYARERMAHKISTTERLRIGLNLMLTIAARFRREESPWSADQLGRYLECSPHLVEEILDDLTEANIIQPSGNGQPAVFQPAVPLANISTARVVEAVHDSQAAGLIGNATPEAICSRTLMEQWREGLWRELGVVGFDVLVDELGESIPPAAKIQAAPTAKHQT